MLIGDAVTVSLKEMAGSALFFIRYLHFISVLIGYNYVQRISNVN